MFVWVLNRTFDNVKNTIAVFQSDTQAIDSIDGSYNREGFRVKVNRGGLRHVALVYDTSNPQECTLTDRFEIICKEVNDTAITIEGTEY